MGFYAPPAGSTGVQMLLRVVDHHFHLLGSKVECTVAVMSGKGSEESHAHLSPHSLILHRWSIVQQGSLVWNLDTADSFARSARKLGICLTASASQGDVMKLSASDAVWSQV